MRFWSVLIISFAEIDLYQYHKKALPFFTLVFLLKKVVRLKSFRGIFFKKLSDSTAFKSYLHRKLYFAILLHLICNEGASDLKKK